MRLSKSKLFAVAVGNFAIEHKMTPRDVAELVILAERAHSAGIRQCNEGTPEADNACDSAKDRFELRCIDHGLRADWNGLWPSVVMPISGHSFNLPCESR